MSDLVDTNLGPVKLSLAFTGGKLVGAAGVAAVGAEGDLSIDGKAVLEAARLALDSHFAGEATLIDFIVGSLEAAILKL